MDHRKGLFILKALPTVIRRSTNVALQMWYLRGSHHHIRCTNIQDITISYSGKHFSQLKDCVLLSQLLRYVPYKAITLTGMKYTSTANDSLTHKTLFKKSWILFLEQEYYLSQSY